MKSFLPMTNKVRSYKTFWGILIKILKDRFVSNTRYRDSKNKIHLRELKSLKVDLVCKY